MRGGIVAFLSNYFDHLFEMYWLEWHCHQYEEFKTCNRMVIFAD